MKLNEQLPRSVIYKEKKYDLDLSFNNVLDVFDILKNDDWLDQEKIDLALFLLIGENDLDFDEQEELYQFIFENYIVIKDEYDKMIDLEGNVFFVNEEKEPVIDLVYDAKFIFASFYRIGINLFEMHGKLHWHEFQALLSSLPDDTIMSQIVKIRTYRPQKNESAIYKAEMRTLQEKYSLEKRRLLEHVKREH